MLGGDGSDVNDAVVTLKSPKLDGDNLTFDVAVLEGSLNGATGPAALFIDHSVADFRRRRRISAAVALRGGGFAGGGIFAGGGFHGGDFAAGGFHGNFAHVNDINVAHVGGTYWHAPIYHGAWYGSGAVAAVR